MTYLNETICNIHFLVLDNIANSKEKTFSNTETSLSNLSWLQKLYLEKALELYGSKIPLYKKKLKWISSFNKSRFFKKLPKLKSLVLSKHACNHTMKAYSSVVNDVINDDKLDKMIRHNNFGCHAHDSITWAVSSYTNQTFYPQKNTALVKKNLYTRWKNYFSDRQDTKQFLKIDPLFHFSWRNKLIPAHEVVHHVNPIKYSDEYCLSKCEWVASAANLNIYLSYLENKYHKTKNIKLKKQFRLEAIAAVLYIVKLIQTIDKIVGENNKTMSIITSWIAEEKVGNINELNKIITAQGELWANTYSKHKIALVYAYNFFENLNGKLFLKSCIDDTIWKNFKNMTKHKLSLDFWTKSNIDINITNWIISKQSKLNNYKFITDPITLKHVLTNSKRGQEIINLFLQKLKK